MTHTLPPHNALLDYPAPDLGEVASGPLSGLTLAVKDIFDVAGMKTGCGNPDREAEAGIAERSAPAVERLLTAGARFVGKTQTDELAFSLMGQNAHFAPPVNPAAPERVTGGSSSGSAAAVAAGLADIATGSDTGGSVRAPASFCGVIGLRTTHGAISLDGAMPLAPSFDTFGWFAKDIDTYAKVGELLLGDATDGPKDEPALRPMRLAVLDDLVLGPAEADEYRRMAAIVAAVLGEAETAPALPFAVDDLYWAFRRLQAHEAWAAHGQWLSAKDRHLGPGVRERFDFGRSIGPDAAAAETGRRNALREALAAMLGRNGLLVLPTVPGAAPRADAPFEALQAYRERALGLLCLSGLTGFPQITLPLGRVDGAPFGISLLGPAGSDRALIGIARTILGHAGKG
ncbi:amidase [Nitratireductor alexandrii]|uniref:amidase n=1 Tax=Nitratireductor alexandrii TaxID=2448161 RepID=UPI000FDBE068|nr:amidase [Nitratireductor alexandrii]